MNKKRLIWLMLLLFVWVLPLSYAGAPIFAYLRQLKDVNTTGIADGKILKYDLATKKWIMAEDSGGAGSGDMTASVYDAAGIEEQVVGLTATQTLTNKTITGTFTGSLTGQASTVATITGLAPDTATTQATQPSITSAANLATVGTIGTGVWQGTAINQTYLVGQSGTNTGDNSANTTYSSLVTESTTVSAPLVKSTYALSIPPATTSANGYLTSTDWNTFNGKAPLTAPTFATSITGSYLTASELVATNASKNIVSLAVATYPSLAELAHLKGMTSKVIDDDQIDTFAELDAIVVDKDLVNKADGADWLGTHDYGGAFLELPNSANPAVVVEGRIAYDTDDEALEVFDGVNSRLIPTVHTIQKTIWDPDGIQSTEDAVPLFYVHADAYPGGIKLLSIQMGADQANSAGIAFEEWSNTTTHLSDIETITFVSSTGVADDGSLADSDIASGNWIFADLDTTDLNFLSIAITYWIKEND